MLLLAVAPPPGVGRTFDPARQAPSRTSGSDVMLGYSSHRNGEPILIGAALFPGKSLQISSGDC
jgi:hypothetical protein